MNNKIKKILITGASGNLGGLLAENLKSKNVELNLMVHKNDISPSLKGFNNVKIFEADLAERGTLANVLRGVDTVVHFAGVLFKYNPEKFLHITNTKYFSNLLAVAVEQDVKRVILISFPHVEGETTPENPAKGILTGRTPISVHAITRLEEEKLLFEVCSKHDIEPIILRLGMVYGKDILMMDAVKTFSKYRILGIWRKPVFIHLISKIDFINATIAAIENDHVNGIYHIGDEGIQTLQEFLDEITQYWGCHKPWRMPAWLILVAAQIFEIASFLFGVRSPLTKDFVKIGMVSYYGDTSRMRKELLPELKYRTFREGLETF